MIIILLVWDSRQNPDDLILRPLRKGKKMKMPLKHQITKIHKELVISILFFVSFCVFVTLWQKKDFSERTQYCKLEIPIWNTK